MKVIMEFQLPDEQEEFNTASKGADYKLALWDVAQEVFRPARKHGYSEARINDALALCNEHGEDLIGELEKKFYDILHNYNIQL